MINTEYKKKGKLIISSTEKSSDLYYASGFSAPDNFIYLERAADKRIFVSPLEYGRALKEKKKGVLVCEIRNENTVEIVKRFSSGRGAEKFAVPFDFPLGLATKLTKEGISLKPVEGSLFPRREVKSASELSKIKTALETAESAMKKAENILSESRVDKNGFITWHGEKLSSGMLRRMIDMEIVSNGAFSKDTIVACGLQSADPHQRGTGFLKSSVPIVIDIFPRDSTLYWGDITRTFVKWKATHRFSRIHETLREVVLLAAQKAKPGIKASKLHQIAFDYIKSQGFRTGKQGALNCGFFHGLGHGVGLDVHEEPRISPKNDAPLQKGNVITIEPGLYYPDFGGVRIEDMIVIGEKDATVLTKYHKNPLIP
jgi:Xaa-Pro aminopeptidase